MPPCRSYRLGLGAALALAFLLSSCASSPAPAPESAPAEATSSASETESSAAPVAKERIVLVKTPVLVKESVYYPDGLLDEYTVYAYDESKTLLLEKTVYDPSRTEPLERTRSEYAANRGPVLDLVYGSDGKLRQRREYALDAQGRPVSERLLDAAGLLQSSSSYAYDAQGRRSEWKAFDGAGLLKAQTLYTYAGAGRLSLMELRGPSGSVSGTIKIELEASAPVEKRSYLGADGSLQKYELFAYRDQKLVRYELRRSDGSLVEARSQEYGELGELLATLTTDGAGKLRERRVYEYLLREDQRVETNFE